MKTNSELFNTCSKCLFFLKKCDMQVEEVLRQLQKSLSLHQTKKEDVNYLVRQDDLETFINVMSTRMEDKNESYFDFVQGVLQLAGSLHSLHSIRVAEYDSIKIVKYLLQQEPLLCNADAVAFIRILNV